MQYAVFRSAAALALCSFFLHAQSSAILKNPSQREIRPAPSSSGNGIYYHGGPVMGFGVNLYFIWYGDWSAESEAIAILTALGQGIGGSPYFNINTTYHGFTGGRDTPVENTAHLAGAVHDDYSQGHDLSTAATPLIVLSAISSGKLPADPNGVYFVLGAPDVTESGFCKSSCGWHGWGTLIDGRLDTNLAEPGGVDIKFAFVGNPATQCIQFCSLYSINFPPPNANAGADAMASILAHELSETVNDPHMDAWFDFKGNETADKCQWTFGSISRIPQGQPNSYAVYNVQLSGRYFLLQQNWVNANGGSCGMGF